jgi:hypothetical protein
MIQLVGKDLDILIYPMDLLISGKPELVARARAAMASRLTTSAAHLTVSAEAQAIEDRLMTLARPRPDSPDSPAPFDDVATAELAAIDEVLAEIRIPYEEWEVLYRQRLQVERDLRAGAMAGEAVVGAGIPGDEASLAGRVAEVARLVRSGATAVLDVAADDETVKSIDRVAGPQWSWAVRLASIGADAARSRLRQDEADRKPEQTIEAAETAADPEATPPNPAARLEHATPAAPTATTVQERSPAP